MRKTILFSLSMLLFTSTCLCQSKSYVNNKAKKIKEGSVFTKIVNREIPATIVYEDTEIIAFVPLRLQAPVIC